MITVAMANHPNRSKRGEPKRGANPTPEQVQAARAAAKLTQTQAGELIFCTLRAWQDWEGGQRRMHPAFWELWHIFVKDTAELARVGVVKEN